MKFGNVYKLYIFLLISFLICTSIVAYKKFLKSRNIIISPIPNFLTSFGNRQVSTLDLWAPIFEVFVGENATLPNITAKSAIVYDLTSEKTLYLKDPNKKLPMASLTKIITAIIALESPKKDIKYVVSKEDLVGENTMGLTSGEVLSLEELLYGLILPSGNDAAETLASNYVKGRKKFIAAMNNKAKSLGLYDTNFTNPSGLEGDGLQHTTAYDLLVITKYAMKFYLFRKVAATVDYHI